MSKRPWFQIHLSTALVLMFAAAALLYVNVAAHRSGAGTLDGGRTPGGKVASTPYSWDTYGWPHVAVEMHSLGDPGSVKVEILYVSLAVDALAHSGILGALWAASEYLIRRRERKRAP